MSRRAIDSISLFLYHEVLRWFNRNVYLGTVREAQQSLLLPQVPLKAQQRMLCPCPPRLQCDKVSTSCPRSLPALTDFPNVALSSYQIYDSTSSFIPFSPVSLSLSCSSFSCRGLIVCIRQRFLPVSYSDDLTLKRAREATATAMSAL